MVFKHILITTDFSQHAHYALERAMQFAKDSQAELTCLHVINENWTDALNVFKEESEQTFLKKQMEKAELTYAQQVKTTASQYPINFVVLTGRAPNQILQYVDDHAIDLIFMGAHGAYYLNDFILGTTTQSVIKQIKIPIQLIKKQPKFTYQRILVTTDFSDASKKAIEAAYKIYPAAEFTLLHVADVWYGKMIDETKQQKELHCEMSQALQEKLAHFLKSCAVEHSQFSLHFVGGYPANDIAHYATSWKADLVVTGARGHSLLHYILVGRVTSRLLRINSTDMLIVPS